MMRKRPQWLFIPLLCCAMQALADDFYAVRPADIDCVVQAAQRQGVPANVLLAISSKESGKNGQSVSNRNGTFDLGHFQINTTHWGPKGVFAAYPAITKSDVAWRGCYNAELAAWLLRQKLDENNGQDFWTRAANYHSRTRKFNDIYKKDLIPLAVKWGKYLERQRHARLVVSYQ
ncbi:MULTISPECIES: transglycosylase SLT domain-containing protein [unclassified Pseudomonas]|uniref:transglycosylase SLT domain-containing protein n=1 Tax=unclassified Pseudomonas TaxID=196821 RepID=UPI00224B9145|nr:MULTISPECIES: transglycosylase SLT domain-containing protein [unclassified Pseudomonas]MCX2889470.1 transglycosylase SLT domain-containing protein [Pseudomonas sp. DCB_BI]MDH4552306.1 conjugal transfer protein TrbN [Pseudomonas sp. BN607]